MGDRNRRLLPFASVYQTVELGAAGSPLPDAAQMLFQPTHRLRIAGIGTSRMQLLQGKVHDVMMMELFRSDVVAELQPYAMQKFDLVGRKVRGMRPQVRDILPAARKVD